MLYIVSGFMRSGTSMMMKALEAGGLEAAYSDKRNERMNKRWGDSNYTPNDNYYELDAADYRNDDFPHAYDGKLIKCLWGGLPMMAPCDARVVFMRRKKEEIQQSLYVAFGTDKGPVNTPDFDSRLEHIISIARDRRSFRGVDVIWYDDVLSHPLSVFGGLADSGWPIDPELSARIPTKSQKRFVVDGRERVQTSG